ncbi:hypothetical protein ACT8ZR_09400 [Neobacillus sp. M.A.Huq-85]
MSIKRIPLCLNTDYPEQKELFDFVTFLPNGKKRNSSAFLRALVDREYQKIREEYLAEKQKFKQEKETPEAPQGGEIKTKGSLKFIGKS